MKIDWDTVKDWWPALLGGGAVLLRVLWNPVAWWRSYGQKANTQDTNIETEEFTAKSNQMKVVYEFMEQQQSKILELQKITRTHTEQIHELKMENIQLRGLNLALRTENDGIKQINTQLKSDLDLCRQSLN